MQYFSTLSKIIYNNPITGHPIILTNLLARTSVVPTTLNNPLIYYKYEVQHGDTPESLAFKYYGDVSRFWIVLFANQHFDPLWCFPLSDINFQSYITNKYNQNNDPTNPNIYTDISNIQEYRVTTTQFDTNTATRTTKTNVVDANTWANFVTSNNSYVLPLGPISIITTKSAISIYDYEYELNESKRTINVVNKDYVDLFESQFKKLMA